MIDPIPLGCVSLDEATMQLAAVICDEQLRNVGRRFSEDYDPAKSDPAKLQWSKRELAIWKLHEALRDGALTGFVREPDTGDFFRLSGTDWHSLGYWRDTILSGVIRASRSEEIARHVGRVLLAEAAFVDWLKASSVKILGAPSDGDAEKSGAAEDPEAGTPPKSAEAQCLERLITAMEESPRRRPKPKSKLREDAKRQFGVSGRMFDRNWDKALKTTGANWNKAGAPSKLPGTTIESLHQKNRNQNRGVY
jgi:hypothetical protein